MEQKLRQEARALFDQGKIDFLIGYESGTLKFTTTPLITKDKNDADRLVVNSFLANNLSVYLPKVKGRIGIVAKGCDSRSIVSLIQDNKAARDKLVIIGVPCSGVIDLSKVEALTGKERDEIDDIARTGDNVVISFGGEKKETTVDQVLGDNCLECEFPTPQEHDILLAEAVAAVPGTSGYSAIARLEQNSPAERWQFWKEHFDRCIRCYACRSVCNVCWCERCFVEETEPQWTSPLPRWQDNLMFQMTRMIHVAGRCTDCGACERACPVKIPLRSLTRKMYDLAGELFDHKAGLDKSAPPLMAAYETEEAENIFR